jgi:hypothetical protein
MGHPKLFYDATTKAIQSVRDFCLVFLPGAETLDRGLGQQTDHRHLALTWWHLQFVIDERVVEANLGGVMAGVPKID